MRRNRLMQLLSDNRGPFTPIAQRVVRESAEEATVYLYDPIVSDRLTAEWWGGVCPQDFVPAIRSIDAQRIVLRINCPGGDVFGTEAMCQALREHKAHVVAMIEGICASAATSIACACDEAQMTPASKYMIHETWTMAMGNKRELRNIADLLAKCDDSMYEEYRRKTGNDLAQLAAWCEAETWFTADEAKAAGFVDGVIDAASSSPKQASRAWRLNAYANKPADAGGQTPPPGRVDPPADDATLATPEHRARANQRTATLARLAPIE